MKRILLIALCFLLFAGCSKLPEEAVDESPSPAPAQTSFLFTEENYPRVDGSTATIPLIEAVESALLGKPRAEVAVTVSKTSGAYVALAQNEADILFVYDGGEQTRLDVAAAMADATSQSDLAPRSIDFDEFFETVPIGKDALVFLVNSENPIDGLTTEQVRGIFSGEYTNWSELGGVNEPIRAYQRGIGSGSQALMDKLVMKELPMANPAKVQVIESMGGLIDAVADFAGGPTGIGYNVYFYVTEMKQNDYIKILSIDGVLPTYETIQSGEYPFVSEFYSVIRKSEPSDSPARALHEWMLTDEAQNLMASENYVALHANPDAGTPYVDGGFSIYPEGEAPVYLEGVNPYVLKASDDYGELYFYLGGARRDEWSSPWFYGLCNAEGKIITEPVYTVATLLTDSAGNKAYFCFRADKEQGSETIDNGEWVYERTVNPALLFATDGSWVMEFDGAMPFYGFAGVTDVIRNADVLVVKREGKWGAVNMKGEVVIPFTRDSYDGIYANPNSDGRYAYIGVTGNRFLDGGSSDGTTDFTFNLYDGKLNLIATGIYGMPSGMAGDFIVTNHWDNQGTTAYTYTIDGKFIAKRALDDGLQNANVLGDYVWIYGEKHSIVCDRKLNTLYEFENAYNEEYGIYLSLVCGSNVLYDSDHKALFHRTYLPDGTRLVTWYDPEMYEY